MNLYTEMYQKEKDMNKAIIAKNAPAAVGPYVHAVQAGNLLFVSGQLGLDPVSGDLKEGLEAQAVQALENMKAVLNEAGYELTDVVKTTVFLSDMDNFAAMNEVYAEFFKEPYPARSAIAVKALPKGALVEVECIAVK